MKRRMYSRGGGPQPVYLTAAQAAKRLGCHRATVYRMVARGDLPGYASEGRGQLIVRSDDVDDYLDWLQEEEGEGDTD